MEYWAKREAEMRQKISDKTIKEIEAKLVKQYSISMKKILGQFEEIYNKIILNTDEDKEPTPADLYKLDKYWQMQAQLKAELQRLGDKQTVLLANQFEKEYFNIYKSTAVKGRKAFSTIDKTTAIQAINQVWVADGKTWSQRVWGNTDKLQQALNETLIDCVITGRKPDELKKELIEKFNVSYRRADCLVRTEITHIDAEASKQRYLDYGIKKYEILVDVDERTCDKCKKMVGKVFYLGQMQPGINAPPLHPNDRCCIVPIIED